MTSSSSASIEIRYERNDIAFERNMIRVRGDTVEVWPAYYKDSAIRIEFFGDEIDRVSEFNPVTGEVHAPADQHARFSRPATISRPRRSSSAPSRRYAASATSGWPISRAWTSCLKPSA